MNGKLFHRVGTLTALIVCVSLTAAPSVADSKRKRSGTNTFLSQLQKNTTSVLGVPGQEISQQITLQKTTKSTDPVLLDMQLTDMGQTEEVAGSGTHRGYSTGILKDGSVTPSRYEGTHKTTVKADGSWEYIGEGKYWLLPGTGKMKNAKGEGTYRCKFNAEGGVCDWEEESEY